MVLYLEERKVDREELKSLNVHCDGVFRNGKYSTSFIFISAKIAQFGDCQTERWKFGGSIPDFCNRSVFLEKGKVD